MSRSKSFGDVSAASPAGLHQVMGPGPGHRTMPQTTQCPNPSCRTVLNIPDAAVGRRLRCPKCGSKFHAGTPGTKPPTSSPGVATAGPGSTTIGASGLTDDELPVAPGDLRETFDLPLMMDEAPKSPGRGRHQADAVALFQDTAPARRPVGADARNKPRRCSCGNVVPAGMSLCNLCGLDLDTGQRHVVQEMLDEVPETVQRSSGPPLALIIVGGVAFLASLILAILSFVQWRQGLSGAQFLGLVCLFGVYASVQFLRGRSAKPLLVALLIGAGIDIVALVILPVWDAQNVPDAPAIGPANPTATAGGADDEDEKIPSYLDRLEASGGSKKITWGIVLLLADAAAFIYLSTSGVRRHFERAPFSPGMHTY
jgi:hypothetical protein